MLQQTKHSHSLLDGNPSEDFVNGNGDPDKYRIDGLCWDWGKGGYRIFVDSQEVHSLQGKRDFRLEQVVFDGSGKLLTSSKTVPVTFEIQTDMYPDEVLWWFESPDASEVWWWRDYQATQVAPHSYIRETVYLPQGGTYYLVVWDRFADGFCCGETGDGFYNLYWGTEVDASKQMVIGDADFGGITNYKDHLIEVSESSIVSPPTGGSTPIESPSTDAPIVNPTAEDDPVVSPTSAPITFAPIGVVAAAAVAPVLPTAPSTANGTTASS